MDRVRIRSIVVALTRENLRAPPWGYLVRARRPYHVAAPTSADVRSSMPWVVRPEPLRELDAASKPVTFERRVGTRRYDPDHPHAAVDVLVRVVERAVVENAEWGQRGSPLAPGDDPVELEAAS